MRFILKLKFFIFLVRGVVRLIICIWFKCIILFINKFLCWEVCLDVYIKFKLRIYWCWCNEIYLVFIFFNIFSSFFLIFWNFYLLMFLNWSFFFICSKVILIYNLLLWVFLVVIEIFLVIFYVEMNRCEVVFDCIMWKWYVGFLFLVL